MGFSGLDHVARAITVLGDGEAFDFEKTPVTAGALVASTYYDLYEAGPNPAANTFPTGSKAFKAVRGNTGSPQAGGVAINAIALDVPSGSKTRHMTYIEHDGGNVANAIGDWHVNDLLGFYCDFDLAAGGTQNTGTGVGVADVTRFTNGIGVFAYIVCQVAFTGTAPTAQLNFTDNSLASVSTAALTLVSTSVRGQVATAAYKVPLGKPGIVALRSITFAGGAAPTGKIAVMLAKKMGKISHATAQQGVSKSFMNGQGEFSLPQWVTDSVPGFVFKPSSTPTTPTINGQFQTAKGYAI